MSADLVRASDVVGKLCDRIEQLNSRADDLERELAAERDMVNQLAGDLGDALEQLAAEKNTAWNDAIKAAAGLASKSVNEGGVAKSLAFFAKSEDHWVYKQACLDYARAILELKRS